MNLQIGLSSKTVDLEGVGERFRFKKKFRVLLPRKAASIYTTNVHDPVKLLKQI